MDITKFNQELSGKIVKAKNFEKHSNLKRAIELWLEISEMTINFSKKPGLEFTFKNMLISKTEQIFQHVRDLRSPKKKEKIVEKVKPKEEIRVPEMKVEETPISTSEAVEPKGLADDDWMDKIEFKEPPNGILEVTPSKDFKILTPHDPNYVENIIKASEENNLGGLMQQQKPKINKADNGTKVFCFACGAEIEFGVKVCNECGTKID